MNVFVIFSNKLESHVTDKMIEEQNESGIL